MAKFIGEYSGKIDDKGRIILPAAFKSLFKEDEEISFVVKKDLYENCLEMYTYSEWEKESEILKSRLNFFNREHAEFWREYMRGRAVVRAAGKLGRITIPRQILTSIGADKEVVFSGNDYKIEIWAKERYQETKLADENFIELAKKILG
ncbi:MAG: hypothetical protein LKI53_04245 [Bacteroidales bacterium]|jgi:MraZ protein|nr:hypothetical protein [Bacteroidales bacterium]